jgi:hypothetical protein
VHDGIAKGHYKPGLAKALAKAPASPAAHEVQQLQQQLQALRRSWTWRLGRMLTKPLDLFARRRTSALPHHDAGT